jgi:hypothetical protein
LLEYNDKIQMHSNSDHCSLQLSYLETVLQAHLTASAKATLETLREQLKKKVIETMCEFETLNSMRSNRATIGEEERLQNPPISPEQLNVSGLF